MRRFARCTAAHFLAAAALCTVGVDVACIAALFDPLALLAVGAADPLPLIPRRLRHAGVTRRLILFGLFCHLSQPFNLEFHRPITFFRRHLSDSRPTPSLFYSEEAVACTFSSAGSKRSPSS